MIRLIQATERHHFARQVDAMHRLRSKVFHDRLGWDVEVVDGWERDRFDDDYALYLIAEDADGDVRGSVRMLPTLGLNMLTDVFPVLLPENESVRSALIWESSRFSVDHEAVAERSGKLINRTTAELLCGMTEVGLRVGIAFIVTVVDVQMERLLRLAKCPITRIGAPRKIGKVSAVAGMWEVGEDLLANLQAANGLSGSVLGFGV